MTTTQLRALFAALLLAVVATGCDSKGPAEKAGQSIDKGARDVKDAVDPPSTGEKVGRVIDGKKP